VPGAVRLLITTRYGAPRERGPFALTGVRHLYHPWYSEGMTSSAPRRPSFDSGRPSGRPASTKALAYWESLRGDLVALIVEAANAEIDGVDYVQVPAVADEPLADTVSSEIDYMREVIRGLRDGLRDARRSGTRRAAAQLEADRLYERDGEIYRTVLSGAGNLYAKIWTDDGWDYAAGAIRDLRPEHRMTVERAEELSVRFGRCIRCGRVLTAEESVARGIGPVCASKI
jgi:hypothetical protein